MLLGTGGKGPLVESPGVECCGRVRAGGTDIRKHSARPGRGGEIVLCLLMILCSYGPGLQYVKPYWQGLDRNINCSFMIP